MNIVNHISNVLIGDRVRWDGCSGTKRGVVTQIFNTQDEFGDYVNFYHIEYIDGFNTTSMVLISETEVEDLNFKVIFRDVDIQIARGEKVFA